MYNPVNSWKSASIQVHQEGRGHPLGVFIQNTVFFELQSLTDLSFIYQTRLTGQHARDPPSSTSLTDTEIASKGHPLQNFCTKSSCMHEKCIIIMPSSKFHAHIFFFNSRFSIHSLSEHRQQSPQTTNKDYSNSSTHLQHKIQVSHRLMGLKLLSTQWFCSEGLQHFLNTDIEESVCIGRGFEVYEKGLVPMQSLLIDL